MKKKTVPFLSLSLFLSVAGAARANAANAPNVAHAPAPQAPAAPKAQVLWDSWYTVKIQGKIPYGYYNDRVERKDGKLAFKNQFWKREEGYINEEQLVAFSEDNVDVTPVLFNFHKTYRNTEVNVDGTVKNGNMLSVKSRETNQDWKPASRSLPKNTFFSSVFPIWIMKRLPKMERGKSYSFYTILEDGVANAFAPVSGRVQLEADDEFAKKTRTKKVLATIENRKSVWYMTAVGDAVRIEFPDQKVTVEKTTEKAARKFLIEKSE